MRAYAGLLAGFVLCVAAAPARGTGTAEQPPTTQEFDKGAALYSQICSHCHGPDMVNPGNVSFDLRKFPHNDRARFFNSVTNGKGGMPPWKDVLSQQEIAAIWAYVRSGGHRP
jgi:mono/diheme cytochrome c family protein